MANVNFTIRIDENTKKEADVLFEELGLTFTAAVNIFIKQALREQGIPFEITKNTIRFNDRNSLEKVANQELEEHLKAYQELAK